MSRVEILKRSRDSVSVKFLEFTRIASKEKVAAFFEGEDEKYYSIRICSIRPDIDWAGINCKGKSNVINLRETIRGHSTYKNSSCMFYIDSDFDDNDELFECEDVYITPCYSIENLYCSDSVFKRILSAEFGVNEATKDRDCFDACVARYIEIRAKYLESITGFNCLLRELRLMEKSGELACRLNVNNLAIDDLVSIDLTSVKKRYDESSPSSIFRELPEGLEVELEGSRIYFEEKNSEHWFRGKQHLEFLRVFLDRLKNDRSRKSCRELFADKGNVKIQLTKANVISELSQYADTPLCLKSFLDGFAVGDAVA